MRRDACTCCPQVIRRGPADFGSKYYLDTGCGQHGEGSAGSAKGRLENETQGASAGADGVAFPVEVIQPAGQDDRVDGGDEGRWVMITVMTVTSCSTCHI
jgi:hypothetical protein